MFDQGHVLCLEVNMQESYRIIEMEARVFMQYEDVQRSALANNNFRKVLFTNKHSQVVLMSLPPGEDIGREVHEVVDQVLVFVKGTGQAVVGGETHDIGAGDMFAVPAGTEHDFSNTGDEALKLFTVYSPPEHPDGVVHATKADALAHPEE
jgi:mannose-6-phosphate isomerase-like protein (cupin superfamily)